MFDTLTLQGLYTQYGQLFDEHTRRYQKCAELHTQDPRYPARRAAMDEIGEHMHAMHAEIQRREAEQGTTCSACHQRIHKTTDRCGTCNQELWAHDTAAAAWTCTTADHIHGTGQTADA